MKKQSAARQGGGADRDEADELAQWILQQKKQDMTKIKDTQRRIEGVLRNLAASDRMLTSTKDLLGTVVDMTEAKAQEQEQIQKEQDDLKQRIAAEFSDGMDAGSMLGKYNGLYCEDFFGKKKDIEGCSSSVSIYVTSHSSTFPSSIVQ